MDDFSQRLVAHRGEPLQFPENSLTGFDTVLQAGASWIETDIHITADKVPVLSHDASTRRLTGVDVEIGATDFTTLQTMSAGYPDRFGDQFVDNRLAALTELAALLQHWPAARAFIEIKRAPIRQFGIETTVECTLDALTRALPQCVFISFDYPTLQYLKANTALPVGYVIDEWTDRHRKDCESLEPAWMFVDHRCVGDGEALWPGTWPWAAYTVNDDVLASRLLATGFDLIETDDYRRMCAPHAATNNT